MTKANKSFKPTPIPHFTKSGEPMAYYVLSEDGQETKVARAICLAPAEKSDNPHPQRWVVDEESGMVVRLPRTQKSDDLARDNMQYIWREAKKQERRIACIAEGSAKCPKTCANCQMADLCDSKHKNTNGLCCAKKCEFCNLTQSRTVELDMFFERRDSGNGDSPEAHFEPADPNDIQTLLEDKALYDTLYTALATLAQEDLELIKDIFWHGKTERELAPLLGLKEPKSVNKRKHRILEALRKNEALKGFFE
jgi:hypothetical protein